MQCKNINEWNMSICQFDTILNPNSKKEKTGYQQGSNHAFPNNDSYCNQLWYISNIVT